MQIKAIFFTITLLMLMACGSSYNSDWPEEPKEGRYCTKSCELARKDCMSLCENLPKCEHSPLGTDLVQVYGCRDRAAFCDREYPGSYNEEQCLTGPHEYCREVLIKGFDPCDWQPCSSRCNRRYEYCFRNCNF